MRPSVEHTSSGRRSEQCVDPGVLDRSSLVARLEQEVRGNDRLEVELLDARRELQRISQELVDSRLREERALHAASHDSLTGLPNRLSFEACSGRAIAMLGSQTRTFGVMYIDIDDFKSINDSNGHAVGDELLRVIGSRLTRAVRAGDSISRHGGDEFLCLLQGVQSEEQVASIARKLFAAVSAPCQLGALTLRVRPSIGVAFYPQDGATVEDLLRSADSAMFWAKRHRLGHAFFGQLPPRQPVKSGSPTAIGAAGFRPPSSVAAAARIPS